MRGPSRTCLLPETLQFIVTLLRLCVLNTDVAEVAAARQEQHRHQSSADVTLFCQAWKGERKIISNPKEVIGFQTWPNKIALKIFQIDDRTAQ